ncbi:MAG: hypothetical protein QM675_07265 [Protaetiibacter sp.]
MTEDEDRAITRYVWSASMRLASPPRIERTDERATDDELSALSSELAAITARLDALPLLPRLWDGRRIAAELDTMLTRVESIARRYWGRPMSFAQAVRYRIAGALELVTDRLLARLDMLRRRAPELFESLWGRAARFSNTLLSRSRSLPRGVTPQEQPRVPTPSRLALDCRSLVSAPRAPGRAAAA